MNVSHSDALVFFGATGDLIYKKIFPNLYAMERRGHLQVPVIGVARSDWTIEKFRARARASAEKHDGFDEAVFAKLSERLRYISGDYGAPAPEPSQNSSSNPPMTFQDRIATQRRRKDTEPILS